MTKKTVEQGFLKRARTKLVVAAWFLITGAAVGVNEMSTPVAFYFDQAFDSQSVKQVLHGLDTTNDKLVVLDSPGGSVSAGSLLVAKLIRDKNFDTYVEGTAASMAAISLLLGDRIYASPTAMILLHQPWVQGPTGSINYKDVEDRIRLVENGGLEDAIRATQITEKPVTAGADLLTTLLGITRLKDLSSLKSKYTDEDIATLQSMLVEYNGDVVRYKKILGMLHQRLGFIIKSHDDAIFENVKDRVLRKNAQSLHGTVIKTVTQDDGSTVTVIDRAEFDKKFFGDGTKDMIFSGKELFEYGLVDDLAPPSFDSYKKIHMTEVTNAKEEAEEGDTSTDTDSQDEK